MSSNFLFNSIDRTKKKSIDTINIDINNIQKVLKNKKNVIKNTYKTCDTVKYKKNLMSLEEKYKDSLIPLNILENNRQKNILEKYKVKNITFLEKNIQNVINKRNNDSIQNILMKKKFLIIPLHLFSKVR